MTDGAGTQHVLRGGLSVAPFSSSVSVRGRCSTQTWSWESTATLATWPNSQLLGSGLGQIGSIWNCGTVWAEKRRGSQQQDCRANNGTIECAALYLLRKAAGLPTVACAPVVCGRGRRARSIGLAMRKSTNNRSRLSFSMIPIMLAANRSSKGVIVMLYIRFASNRLESIGRWIMPGLLCYAALSGWPVSADQGQTRDLEKGKRIFDRYCSSCHGTYGRATGTDCAASRPTSHLRPRDSDPIRSC